MEGKLEKISDFLYTLQYALKNSGKLSLFVFCDIFCESFQTYIYIFIPGMILNELSSSPRVSILIGLVLTLFIGECLTYLIPQFLGLKFSKLTYWINMNHRIDIADIFTKIP